MHIWSSSCHLLAEREMEFMHFLQGRHLRQQGGEWNHWPDGQLGVFLQTCRQVPLAAEKVPLSVCDPWESLFHAQHRLNPSHESGPPICPLRQFTDVGWDLKRANDLFGPRQVVTGKWNPGSFREPCEHQDCHQYKPVSSLKGSKVLFAPSFFLSCHLEWPP